MARGNFVGSKGYLFVVFGLELIDASLETSLDLIVYLLLLGHDHPELFIFQLSGFASPRTGPLAEYHERQGGRVSHL